MARTPLRDDDPRRIGHYRLTARLGQGGMGVVYLGVSWDGQQVAVKVLRPELAGDPEFRQRFGREVAVLVRVRGECTVRVIEADTQSAIPFMVTEYAEGPSLADYIDAHGSLGPGMLRGLAAGLAEALTVIHEAGIVHRDLKPSNIILTESGPKVIDFGIARLLDAASVTQTGMMVGSAGFMAPEQITGHPGPAADIFVWGLTIAYAATGQSPFGTGDTHSILYRVLYADADASGVPEPLRPLVQAALAKEPQARPTARDLLDRLTTAPVPPQRQAETPTQTILSQTWQPAGSRPAAPSPGRARRPEPADRSLLLDPARPGAGPRAAAPPARRRRVTVSRSTLVIAGSAVTLAAVAIVVVALVTGQNPKLGPLTADQANQPGGSAPVTAAFGAYPGQQQRGVFTRIDRIVASGSTIVTTGSQTADGVARQQFFASADGGRSWHLAPVRTPGGGQPPLGHTADRIAAGPRGWMAEGPQSVWTSGDGRSWTLAATHGIAPRQHGDSVWVVTGTPGGFLAGGQQAASGGAKQAVIWTSRDGVSWQRTTAAQLGLASSGQAARDISYAASSAGATVISGGLSGGGSGVWLSAGGASAWTPVSVPVDHGADNAVSGVAADGSGLIAVRPGRAAIGGAADGVVYFSPDGLTWQYAATIGADQGWRPAVVKGGDHGFVVTGVTAQDRIVAYTSTGTGGSWRPTGSLGEAGRESVTSVTVAPGGTVVAVGSANSGQAGQQAVFVEANTAGNVHTVAAPGLVPEITVNSTAVAGGQQIAVGSANGYPAVWRRVSGGPWVLVSALPLVSAGPDLAALTSVTHGPAGWLAVGTPGPVVLASADGMTWHPAAGSIAQDLAGASVVSAASGPAGYAVAGQLVTAGGASSAGLWWSPDLAHWTRAHVTGGGAGSSQVRAVAATAHGFVSAGSHAGRPAVWTTADGRAWKTTVLPAPGGASGAGLEQVAVKGNLVAALGRAATPGGAVPFAERSADGGLNWAQAPFSSPGPGTTFTALTAGPGGFTAAARFGASGQQDAAVWTSALGTSWKRSPVAGLGRAASREITALAPSGSAVTGIASLATQQSQQFVTLTVRSP